MLATGFSLRDRYEIQAVLGQGGMGFVYLAHDTVLGGKRVAVKEMAVHIHNPEHRAQAMRQFQNEATLLASLSHPRLVDVTDYFEVENNAYLVMAFVDGRTLESIMHESPGLVDVNTVLDWADQVCDVLDYLHHHEPPVLFRDLKPANIMLDNRGTVRLIDFGIARTLEGESKTSTFLKGAGTAEFAPVEQFGGSSTDARSDVYSLGATLFNLLTHQLPPISVTVMVGEETLPIPSSINPAVSPALDAVILHAMAFKREERFQSIRDMRAALLSCRGSNGTSVPMLQERGMPWPAGAGLAPIGSPTVMSRSGQMAAATNAAPPEPPMMMPATAPAMASLTAYGEPARTARHQGLLALILAFFLGLGGMVAWRMHQAANAPTATVALMSDPSTAHVELDNRTHNTTPWDIRRLAVGEHTLDFTADDRLPVPVHIRVLEPKEEAARPGVEIVGEKPDEVDFAPADGFATLKVKFRHQQGTLRLTVSPSTVEVLVDKKKVGSFSSGDMVPIDTGAHHIELQAAGYKPFEQAVAVKWNTEEPLQANLAPYNGTLSVATSPAGASVWLDGQQQSGHTPLTLHVPAHAYSVVIRKSGYRDLTASTNVQIDKKTALELHLSKAPPQVAVVHETVPVVVASSPPVVNSVPDSPQPAVSPSALPADTLPPAPHELTPEEELKREEFEVHMAEAFSDVRAHPMKKTMYMSRWNDMMEKRGARHVKERLQLISDLLDRVIAMPQDEFTQQEPSLIAEIWRYRVMGIRKL